MATVIPLPFEYVVFCTGYTARLADGENYEKLLELLDETWIVRCISMIPFGGLVLCSSRPNIEIA